MNVITGMQRPGEKTLPPELRGWHRLAWGANQMQTHGGVRGIAGLGVTEDLSSVFADYQPVDVSYSPGPLVGDGSVLIDTYSPAASSGLNLNALANIITVSSNAIARTMAASNPGTMYRDPSGALIYSQPTGSTQNLPIGSGVSVVSPLGSLQTGGGLGISTTTLMIGGLGLLAIMMLSGGGRR